MKRRSWWRRPRRPGWLERKFGVFGTKGFVLAELALVAGIAETAWLRWFVLASLIGGCLIALILHHVNQDS